MSKKSFSVKMPFTGYINIIVEADNEQEAKDLFFEEYDKCSSLHDAITKHDGEWDFHEQVVQGNVFHGVLNKMEISDEQ